MPRTRDLLLPPILQVIEKRYYQREYTEGVSSVITWIDFDQLDHTKYKLLSKSKRPQTPLSCLMKTIDLRDAEPTCEGIEHFSYIVCFPDEEFVGPDHGSWDSRTVFNEGRPVTSRRSRSGQEQHGGFQGMLSSLARKFKSSRKVDAFPLERVQQHSL